MTADERPTIEVASAAGGWPAPWHALAEVAALLDPSTWTLVGGLMTQLHTQHHGIGIVRPTNDIDLVLHIETTRGIPNRTATVLESIGYELRHSFDPRNNAAHRFVRDGSTIDLVASPGHDDVIDVLIADHPAPVVIEQLRGRDMVKIEGGTQALGRTVNASVEIEPGAPVTISVPRPFGAVILKAAAFATDSRDPDRHLFDAAALLACVEQPLQERMQLAGSDRKRLGILERALPDEHPAWRALPARHRNAAMAALRLLCASA